MPAPSPQPYAAPQPPTQTKQGTSGVLVGIVAVLSVIAIVGVLALTGVISFNGGGSNVTTTPIYDDEAVIDDGEGDVVEPAEPEPTHESRYDLIVADVSWTEANAACENRGGHLVTITSQEEMDEVVKKARAANTDFVWIGAYIDDANQPCWVTGEDFSYSAWYPGEPSHSDADGTKEKYVELWHIKKDDSWSWNDERDWPLENSDVSYMSGRMGYVCEYNDGF